MVVVVVNDVAFSILRALIPILLGLSAVKLLHNDMYWAPRDPIAPMIFLQDVQWAFAARGSCLALLA